MAENDDHTFVPTGYNDSFYSSMYMSMYQKLLFLHGNGQNREAMELFDNMVGHFATIFDELYIKNVALVDTFVESVPDITYKQRSMQAYRLKLSEFARLIVRCGIAPKPDVRIEFDVPWEVPKDLTELSFAGEVKGVVKDETDNT